MLKFKSYKNLNNRALSSTLQIIMQFYSSIVNKSFAHFFNIII